MDNFDEIEAMLSSLTTTKPKEVSVHPDVQLWRERCQQAENNFQAANKKLSEKETFILKLVEAIKEERRRHEEELNGRSRKIEELESEMLQYEEYQKQLLAQLEYQTSQTSSTNTPVDVSQYESKIHDLTDQLATSQFESQELSKKLTEAVNSTTTLQADLKKLTDERTTVTEKFHKLSEIAKEFKSKYESSSKEVTLLRDQITSLQSTSEEANTLLTKVSLLNDEVQVLKNKVSEREARIQFLEEENKGLMSQNTSQEISNVEREATSTRIKTLQDELMDVKEQRDKALASQKQSDISVTTLTSKLNQEKEMNKSMDETNKKLTEAVDLLKRKVEDEERKANKIQTVNEELEIQLKDRDSDISDFKAKIDTYAKKETELEKSIVSKDHEIETMKQKLVNLPTVTSPQPTVQVVKESSPHDKKQILTLQNENTTLRQQLETVKSELSKAQQLAQAKVEVSTGLSPPPPPTVGLAPPPPSSGNLAPPPPPPGGPPPPPPPPPSGGPSSTKLKITKTGQSSKMNQAPPSEAPPDTQNELLLAIRKGISLKKSRGPESVEDKLKRIEEDKAKAVTSGSPKKGGPMDFANLGLMAKQLALQRQKRMETKEQEETVGRKRRESRLDVLLKEKGLN